MTTTTLIDSDFDALFTRDRPVVFAYHGLTYSRANHDNLHVRGFIEEGTTTTPFDMVVMTELDRFHVALEAIHRVPGLATRAAHVVQALRDKLTALKLDVREHGEDMPEIRDWNWPYQTAAEAGD